MSWKATQYVKELRGCPDGAPLSRGQKLLLFVLADYHNTTAGVAWPSLPVLAAEAMESERQAQRDIAYLEAHGLIKRQAPKGGKFGRGWTTEYRFLALDPDRGEGRQSVVLSRPQKGRQSVVLSEPERVTEGRQEHAETVTEGRQVDTRNKEITGERYERENIPREDDAGRKTWNSIADDLRKVVDPHSFETWIKPVHGHALEPNVLWVGVPCVEFLYVATKYSGRLCDVLEGSGIAFVRFFVRWANG